MNAKDDPAETLRKTCMSLGAAEIGISTLEASALSIDELFDWVATATEFCRERDEERERRQNHVKNI